MHNMLLFIIFHVVGDFYLQSDEVAKNKENLNIFMLIHSIIYSIPFVLLFIYFKINVSLLIIITLSHLLIDVCSVKLKNKYKEKECLIFCSDQFIHIFIIYLCSSYMNLTIILSNMALISILAILILVKPTGVLISLAFKVIFKEEKSNHELKIGTYIGYLERIIIFLLCIFDSISTIGFIIAAKTLVRYKDINNNKNHFQEKYLIGTLLSTIGALCCFALIKFLST
ncbi:hypothetical protein HMPREF1094_00551 [[Clostridium] innocuum 2959]|uniref:DUF3307 domain-containing protein n=2 Tax=Clostridium innocuum TaxID=1522 RepID=N9VBV0_CLOIN|nr:DUF3307 domain-containing protein [[Clostridium] innocuum]ENY88100.1 hypothetical protein HMPREF1094_00551 [[Clostridium] innocuum 2959]